MDFQRKFNKHVLIWGRLFICCLVFIGRNIALSYMPSNRQCLKDTVLHSVFNSDGVSFKNQNSWSFIIFLSFKTLLSGIVLYQSIFYISFAIFLYQWHVQNSICTFAYSYRETLWNFMRKSWRENLILR